jgi:hypothetical protein
MSGETGIYFRVLLLFKISTFSNTFHRIPETKERYSEIISKENAIELYENKKR